VGGQPKTPIVATIVYASVSILHNPTMPILNFGYSSFGFVLHVSKERFLYVSFH
jgi:hypothetical protein